jgi:hypothetical protein
MIISSQRYIDDMIVAEKVAIADYMVSLSPIFVIDGVEYQAFLDGHHSLEAARVSGSSPVFVEIDCSDSDNIGLIDDGKIEDFLTVCHIDDNWYNIEDGKYVW